MLPFYAIATLLRHYAIDRQPAMLIHFCRCFQLSFNSFIAITIDTAITLLADFIISRLPRACHYYAI